MNVRNYSFLLSLFIVFYVILFNPQGWVQRRVEWRWEKMNELRAVYQGKRKKNIKKIRIIKKEYSYKLFFLFLFFSTHTPPSFFYSMPPSNCENFTITNGKTFFFLKIRGKMRYEEKSRLRRFFFWLFLENAIITKLSCFFSVFLSQKNNFDSRHHA
jgi:hypothetical protein